MDNQKEFNVDYQTKKFIGVDDYVQFAQIFNNQYTQDLIKTNISKILLEQMKANTETRNTLKTIIREAEKESFVFQIKAVWTSVKYIFTLIFGTALGVAVTILVQKFLSK